MLSAVSLFSGAGGMDLGVGQAGFTLLACIDSDPYCCETLRAAAERERRPTLVLEADIRSIHPINLMDTLGVRPGDVDLLCAGSPCQSFSQIGTRSSIEDERGLLLFEIVRFAKDLQPRAILIEQVTGLLNARDQQGIAGGVFKLLLDELSKVGYETKWKVIMAAEHGVPQLRRRVFLVSMPKPNTFEFPVPTHVALDMEAIMFTLPCFKNVGEALRDLSPPASKDTYHGEDSHVDITPVGDRQRIRGVPEGEPLVRQLHLPSEQRRNLTRKDTTKFRRLSRQLPALTLRCGEIFFHPVEDRYLTVRECLRLHSYPDHYIIKGPIRGRSGQVRYLDQYRQVANSVPPLIAKVLAVAIRKALECPRYLNSSAIH